MLRITLTNDNQNLTLSHERGPLEFGRAESEDARRIVVEDRYVSRNQFRLCELEDHSVRLTGLGSTPVSINDQETLNKGDEVTVPLPVVLSAGYTTIQLALEKLPEPDSALQTINRPVRPKPQATTNANAEAGTPLEPPPFASLGQSPPPEVLAEWFERLLAVQHSAAGSAEFYDETAQAVVDLVGLDRGMVLLREEGNWLPAAIRLRDESLGGRYSQSVLAHVVDQGRTFFQSPDEAMEAASLRKVEAVVASPIFGEEESIIGVVYGSRDLRSPTGRKGIDKLEAQVVQLLAGAVSSGLARVDQEAEAARMRVQFEQFSSPELARELERSPKLLEGQEREITVMFSDIRGFSRMSEQLGPERTYELVGDVMDLLTEQVLNHSGVIIDYYGDGLAAMWNAPTDVPQHAARACEAAIAMRDQLPKLNAKWSVELGRNIEIGVGVHTGKALVGNAGSRRRLKYGPRGHTVNMASRVEGATKYLGAPILITRATREQFDDSWSLRRMGRVQVAGVREAAELFQVGAKHPDDDWNRLRSGYEEAVAMYERRQWQEALQRLESLIAEFDDPACRLLQTQITRWQAADASAVDSTGELFDGVIQLDSK